MAIRGSLLRAEVRPRRQWSRGRARRLGFFDQAQRGTVQIVQLRFARLVFGELHEVATLKEFAQAVLLIARQQIGAPEFVKELLGGALRSSELEALFEVVAGGVGHRDAKRLRLRDERQGFLQLLLRANMRRHRRYDQNFRLTLPPPSPKRE